MGCVSVFVSCAYLFYRLTAESPTGFFLRLSSHSLENRSTNRLNDLIPQLSDWYGVRRVQVEREGGEALFASKQRGSLSLILQAVYPDYSWDETRFLSSNKQWRTENIMKALDRAEKELGIQKVCMT